MSKPEPFDAGMSMFISDLMDSISMHLREYAVFCPSLDVVPYATNWTVQTAISEGLSSTEVIMNLAATKTVDAAAETVAQAILFDLAEERPGTDVWKSTTTVPVPAVEINSIIFHCGYLIGLAIENGDPEWAQEGTDAIVALTRVVSDNPYHLPSTDYRTDSSAPSFAGSNRAMTAPVPQAAVARLARYMECVARRLDKKVWHLPAHATLTAEILGESFTEQAYTLREINRENGQSAGPRLDG
jgi:hypothetical protein